MTGETMKPLIYTTRCQRGAIVLMLTHMFLSPIISQTFTPVTTGSPVAELGAWRSVNWIDYDSDGDLDLFVTRGKVGGQDNVLFRNDGPPNFTFTRMSSLVISQDHEPSDGSTWADIDNDGDPDCFAVNWYNRNNLLYRNSGDGTFARILAGSLVTDGGYSETASWGDYNNDGLVDIYVSNSAGSKLNFMYKNIGNGQFSRILTGPPVTDASKSRGVNWIDYDNDGDLDIFVANEANENDALYKNMLKETGVDTFARVIGDPIVADGGSSWSGSWGDYDNDGDPDVAVINSGGEKNAFYVNNGNGSFTRDSLAAFANDPGWGASAAWADIDNDGDLDLVVSHAYAGTQVTNYLYINRLIETGVPTLQRETTGPMVTDLGYSYGLNWGDYDEDGDLDLFVARTFSENQTNAFYKNNGNSNHWLTLECRGTTSNASAIGTKIRAKATINGQPVWQVRVVEGQSGYCGQNLRAHFGLRDATSLDSLLIEWPSGAREIFTGVQVNRDLSIVENDSTPIAPVTPANGFFNSSVNLTLKWNRSLYIAPYRLQISTDSAFGGGIVLDTVVTPDTAANVWIQHPTTRYYWRVKPARSIHENTWSALRYFDNVVTFPDPPQLLFPSDLGVNIPLTLKLLWTRQMNATGYHLLVATDSLYTATLRDTILSDTSLNISGLQYLTRYFWKVRGTNIAGESPASFARSFTTIIEAPAIPLLLSPADEAIDVTFPVTLAWSSGARAEAYDIQISIDSTFVTLVVDDTALVVLTLSPIGLQSLTKYYWRVRSSNIGGKSPFSPLKNFKTILAAPNLRLPAEGAVVSTSTTFRWMTSPPAVIYRFECTRDSTFSVVEIVDSTEDTSLTRYNLQLEETYYWRIRANHTQGVSAWSVIRRFVTGAKTYTYHPTGSWSLVSVPASVPDLSTALLFPGRQSSVFEYDGAYHRVDTLTYGKGYWVKLTPLNEVVISGVERFLDTIDINAGWNLIGAISMRIPAANVVSIPGGLVTSSFFGYKGAYKISDTLEPFDGYWLKSSYAGKLVLSSQPTATDPRQIHITHTSELPPSIPGNNTDKTDLTPESFGLAQNFPNPFNPSTVIRYSLPVNSYVTLKIYSLLGQEVETLVDRIEDAGDKSVDWNASALASGYYIYKLTAISGTDSRLLFTDTKKLTLLK